MSEGAKGDAADLALAAEFPAASREQWLALVSGVLKGAPFERRLVSKTYDGLSIEPLYARQGEARAIAPVAQMKPRPSRSRSRRGRCRAIVEEPPSRRAMG